jgi:DNA polymerase-1
MIGGILKFLNTNEYTCYLTSTDHSNFRYDIHPEYKANRKTSKPTHYDLLRDFLCNCHGAELVYGQEADDALAQAQIHPETVIVSIDKDLDQIPGLHFNFVKGILYEVSVLEARRHFWKQCLTGDPTDNIPGIRGLGPVRANKIIGQLTTDIDMYDTCVDEYKKAYGDSGIDLLERNAQLLHLRPKQGITWVNPYAITLEPIVQV